GPHEQEATIIGKEANARAKEHLRGPSDEVHMKRGLGDDRKTGVIPDKPDERQATIRDGKMNPDEAKALPKGGSQHQAYEVEVHQPDGPNKKIVFHADEFGDSELRLRNDKAAYKLNQMMELDNGFPATIEREATVPAPNEVKAATEFDPGVQKFKGGDGKIKDEELRRVEQ